MRTRRYRAAGGSARLRECGTQDYSIRISMSYFYRMWLLLALITFIVLVTLAYILGVLT